MPELPDLPADWTDGASAAYLLLGIAIIDGVLHDEETSGVYDRLARHVDADAAVLEQSVHGAWAYLQQVMEAGGMDAYLDSLQAHCYALRGSYDKKTLEGLVGDIAEVAQADGEVASAEVAYIAAISEHLGVSLSRPRAAREAPES